MNHISSQIEFSLSSKLIYVVTCLSLIIHLLLSLDCILTNDLLYIIFLVISHSVYVDSDSYTFDWLDLISIFV